MDAGHASPAELTAWVRDTARLRAQAVVPVAGGEAVLHGDFPFAHDHNKLVISSPCEAVRLAADTERILGGAGCRHRLIDVLSADLADDLAPGLIDAGYVRDNGLLMRWDPPQPATALTTPALTNPAAPGGVVEIGVEDRAAAGRDSWQEDLPEGDAEVWRQLGARARTATGFATFFAIRSATGAVASRADLYVRDGIAQVEDVHTRLAHRGNGLASLVVTAAVQQALTVGAHTVFLIADADDWPQRLYRKLGFSDLGMTAEFAIPPATG